MSMKMMVSDRRFWPLFWTQFIGALGDNVFKNALVMMVTFQNATVWGIGKAQVVALSGGLFILPFFLFSPLAGQIADRIEKSRLVRITKYWEIGVMSLAAAGFYFHAFGVLLVVLFLAGVQSTLFGPVKYSMIPELVRPSELIEANAYVEGGTFLAILIGTMLGTKLVSLPSGEVVVGAFLIALAVSGMLTALFVTRVTARAPDLKIEYNPLPTFKSLYAILQKRRSVFNSVLGISWFWFFGAAVLSILPLFCVDHLHGNDDVLNCFLAMFTVGIALGSILCEKLSFQRVELGLVPLGSVGMTVFLIDLCVTQSAGPTDHVVTLGEFLHSSGGIHMMIDFFCMSIAGGFFILPLYTLLQERSAPEERSRVIAANNIMNAVFMVAASLLVMAFNAAHLSYPQMFLLLAILNLAVSFYIYSVVPEFTIRFWSWILARLIYRIQVEGEENVPRTGGAILVCNHVSFVDWMIIMALVKRPTRFVIYFKYFDIPIARILMKQAGVIPIAGPTENRRILLKAFHMIDEALAEGDLICIFPEGQLTRTGEMDAFRTGIERMLDRNPAPVVPMALHDLWGTFFTHGGGMIKKQPPKHFRKRVRLVIGKPIPPAEVTAATLEARVKEL